MYFDLDYYLRLLRFAWSQKHWPRRRRTVATLALWVPLQTLIHTVFFLLDYLLFPRLWLQRVEQPVFIVGHARSGTTLMQRLMALDRERFSFFLYWETFFPALSERMLLRGLGRLDRWLLGGRLRRRLEAWDDKTFGPWRHIHAQGLWLAEEDLFVLRAACIPQQWTLEMPVSHVLDIFHVDDLSPTRRRRWLRHYRECVKRQLVYHGGGRCHLSKNPVMSGWVNALLDTFPDARIVVMLRDPAECIPSTLKLVEGSWRARGWQPGDWEAAMKSLIRISYDCYHLPAQALASHPNTAHRVVDYRDLVQEPLATLERTCADLELPVSAAQREAVRALESPGGRHRTRFRYALEDFPVTAGEIEQELAAFYRRYGWPRHTDRSSDSRAAGEASPGQRIAGEPQR
jgi:hypothetical protein